jgi:hypothetical protein
MAGKTSPELIAGAASGELAHGSLRLWDAIAISVSVLAPGMASCSAASPAWPWRSS